MAIKAGAVTVGAAVTLLPSPGLFIVVRYVDSDVPEVMLTFSGAQGVLEIGKLVEALTVMRDDLRAKVDA